jgi:flagellar basal-body rod protein FlgG
MSGTTRILALGLVNQQRNIDTIGDNLSNLQTPGYKRRRVAFSEIGKGSPAPTSGAAGQGPVVPGSDGMAVSSDASALIFAPGQLTDTGNPFDVALEGPGFLQVQQADGTTAYTRDGQLGVDAQGRLTVHSGQLVVPAITLPPDSQLAGIDRQGQVSAFVNGQVQPQVIGQITLARFTTPEALRTLGGGFYAPTVESGNPVTGAPGAAGFPLLRTGSLEESNVDIAEEMTRLIQAQRAYQLGMSTIRGWNEAEASKLRG